MTIKKPLLLGAHISIAGGLEKAIERGESINCTCIQFFTKSNRQWYAKPLQKEEIVLFKKAAEQSTIQDIVVHASYLINIGSADKELGAKSASSLQEELQRAEALGIPYLVLHPGSRNDSPLEECLERIAKNINIILEKNPGKTMILLETMAGQGSTVGDTFDQLATIYKKIDQKHRVGFCVDTCHLLVAGYDFRDKKSYEALWQEFDKKLGLKKLKAFHLNDSKKDLGSRVDRHENIGKGKVGLEAFSLLLNDERFFDIPKILETPKESLADDVKNMNALLPLLDSKTRKILSIPQENNKK
ncbi:MAG: deoxyribonuclease IV [Candidatus Babeliales bacterium]